MIRRIRRFLVTCLVAYLIVLGLLRVFEYHLLFFPNDPGRLSGDWHPRGLDVQDVWITTSDGIRLHAWWLPNEKATFTFLAFHGNASNIANRMEIYRFLSDAPANVLAVEYRGYGRSEGRPSESGLYLDAEAAYNFLVNSKGIEPRRIISYGQSLGTAVAAHLAAEREVGGVILEAPFPSASRVVRRVFWFFPGLSLLVLGQLNTQRQLAHIRAPILIVHCTQDPVIAYQFGQEVYESAPQPKSFLRIDGYCHEESSLIAPTTYRVGLEKFLVGVERN